MKINPIVLEQNKQYSPYFNRILSAIKRYDRIIVFRHIMPDFDALGSQLGLYTWLKDNFPEKEVKMVGDNHVTFTPRVYPVMDSVSDSYLREKPFLGIVLDVGNVSRIADPRIKKAKFKIKIDHHPETEVFANVSMTDTTKAAAAEIIANMLIGWKKKGYVLSADAAAYLYSGIVGDSGRFQYSSTSSHTFAVCEELLNTGISISKIYQKMYEKKIDDLKVTAYILNHFSVSEHGVAYYVLDNQIQKELNITTERGKENVNLFSNIDGINAWASITEDGKEPCWRVSLRSKEKAINGVAAEFEGGGHAQASGCKLNTLEDLPRLIDALDNLFK